MPLLKLPDVSHNLINSLNISDTIEYLSIQFNPITNITFNDKSLSTIKELDININTYNNIYSHYSDKFTGVHIRTNEQKLEQIMNGLGDVFEPAMARYIYKRFCNIEFKDREAILKKITLRFYNKYFMKNQKLSVDEIENTSEFKCLLDNITKFYYRTIVVTLYFNGHY